MKVALKHAPDKKKRSDLITVVPGAMQETEKERKGFDT